MENEMLIALLRCPDCSKCPHDARCRASDEDEPCELFKDAADCLTALAAELEKVKAEREAMFADLKRTHSKGSD